MACTQRHPQNQRPTPGVNWKSSKRRPPFLDWGAAQGIPEGQRVDKSLFSFVSSLYPSLQAILLQKHSEGSSVQAGGDNSEGENPSCDQKSRLTRAVDKSPFSSPCPPAALPRMQVELLKVRSRAGKIKPKLSGQRTKKGDSKNPENDRKVTKSRENQRATLSSSPACARMAQCLNSMPQTSRTKYRTQHRSGPRLAPGGCTQAPDMNSTKNVWKLS